MTQSQTLLLMVGICYAVVVFVGNMFCMEDKYKMAREYSVKVRIGIWFAILLWPLTAIALFSLLTVVAVYFWVKEFFTWPFAKSLDR